MRWNGSYWERDRTIPFEIAMQVPARIRAESISQAPKTRELFRRWADQSENEGRIRAVIKLAETSRGVKVDPEDLDANPWLLCCQNGVYDVRTDMFRPPNPKDLLTKCTSVPFDAAAKCSGFRKFFDRIIPDPAERSRIQVALGYSLTGLVSEQRIFYCFGRGANGKSTLLETVASLLGEYAAVAEPTMFIKRSAGSPRDDIASLAGARFVKTVELRPRGLDISLLKSITGGDTIRARHLYGRPFEYAPTYKLWITANDLPSVRIDPAVKRRLDLIHFSVSIPEPEWVRGLDELLVASEGPGILAWLLRGASVWRAQGLSSSRASEAFQSGFWDILASDSKTAGASLARFFSEKCSFGPDLSTDNDILYSAYRNFCGREKLKPASHRLFSLSLLSQGGVARSRNKRSRVWTGVGLTA
jgi:putative DNA primase/helicase